MNVFDEYLESLSNEEQKKRMEEVLSWIAEKYPQLEPVVKWNQPMFTDHGTYIIGFSSSKQHMAVAPEQAGITQFIDDIKQAGYDHTKEIVRIKWKDDVDYSLLEKMIEFNIADKAGCTTFWR